MPKICRACQSSNITSREIQSEYTPPIGRGFVFLESVDTCGDCHLEGDFEVDSTQNNDARFDAALAAAQRQHAASLIESLKSDGFGMAHMERILGLSPRTMFRWKNEGLSSSAYALLNIVAEFPGLLEVCKARFSSEAKRTFFWTQHSYVVRTSEDAVLTEMKTKEAGCVDNPTLETPVAA